MRITLIGSGNVATQLGRALQGAGENIIQVWSRSIDNASALARELQATPVADLSDLAPDADLYIISVNDDAISSVASSLRVDNRLVVHTSGSTAMEALGQVSQQLGVLYPLQTFTKSKPVNFRQVPLAIEGTNEAVLSTLRGLAQKLSEKVVVMDSVQRQALHVAAVFACNFTNHLYALAAQLLHDNNLEFDLLRPLIKETADKVQEFLPAEVQTGPAIRGDQQTMSKHLELLKQDEKLRQLYLELSQSIVNFRK